MAMAFAAWREGHEWERHARCLGLHATGKAARMARKKAKQQWQQTLHRSWSKDPPFVSEKKNNKMWMTRGWSIFFFKSATRLVRNKLHGGKAHSSFTKRHQLMSGRRCISRMDHHLRKKQAVGRAHHAQSRPSDGRSSKACGNLNHHPGKPWMLKNAQTFSRF